MCFKGEAEPWRGKLQFTFFFSKSFAEHPFLAPWRPHIDLKFIYMEKSDYLAYPFKAWTLSLNCY